MNPRPASSPRAVLLGKLVITKLALSTLSSGDVLVAIRRHTRGDWGDVCLDDQHANDRALANGGRILSIYRSSRGERFWIITEADRSATTVLLPEDY
jgi:hypothetical protein